MTTTHNRLFGAGELNQREYFGIGFARSRSPSPAARANPISWDAVNSAGAPPPPVKRMLPRGEGPYAHSSSSDACSTGSQTPSFLGSRKRRISEHGPSPSPTPTVVALLSPNLPSREIVDTRPKTSQIRAQSPITDSPCSQKRIQTRKNFPEKRATCGVNLGLRHSSPRVDSSKDSAFDVHYNEKRGEFRPRARFYSSNSASFVSRKRHYSDDSPNRVVNQPESTQASSEKPQRPHLHEHIAIAPGRGDSFTSPHRVSQKSRHGSEMSPAAESNFRSLSDAEFHKKSKHMMKKMFHNDPMHTTRRSVNSGLGMLESAPSRSAASLRSPSRSTRSIRPDAPQPLSAMIADTLRQRERAGSHKLVWKP